MRVAHWIPVGKREMNCLDSWPWTSRCCTGAPPSESSSSMVLMAAVPASSWNRERGEEDSMGETAIPRQGK